MTRWKFRAITWLVFVSCSRPVDIACEADICDRGHKEQRRIESFCAAKALPAGRRQRLTIASCQAHTWALSC